MTEMAIKTFIVDPERRTVVVELWMGDQALGHITLDAAQTERLIHRLAECRANLAEEVPREYEHGESAAGIVIDPTWSVLAQPDDTHKILALRHAGLGWLPFVLPVHQQAAIAKVLSALPPSGTAH
jgi:hypothetical protein